MIINKKEVSLRFGMLSVEIFLNEADKINGLSFYSSYGLAKIIHAGVVNYYDVKQLPHPVTFEEIYDFVEDEMLSDGEMEQIKQVIKEFEGSQALKKKSQQISDATEEIKKKLIGTIPEPQLTVQD